MTPLIADFWTAEQWPAIASIATAALALGTFAVALATLRTARAAQWEASSTRDLVTETLRDRELSIRPFLHCYGDTLVLSTLDPQTPAAAFRNIGRGPAFDVVLWAYHDGHVFYKSGITLAPGEGRPNRNVEIFGQLIGSDWEAIDSARSPYETRSEFATVVGSDAINNLIAYCRDELGNRLRFNLRNPDPPAVWPRDAKQPPPWSGAWKLAGLE